MRTKAKVKPVVPWQVKLVVLVDAFVLVLGFVIAWTRYTPSMYGEVILAMILVFGLLGLLDYGLIKGNKIAFFYRRSLVCIDGCDRFMAVCIC